MCIIWPSVMTTKLLIYTLCRVMSNILTDHTTCHIFFTTNGSDPNPAYRRIDGEEITHVYIGPFKLKRGHRIIKALATSKYVLIKNEVIL